MTSFFYFMKMLTSDYNRIFAIFIRVLFSTPLDRYLWAHWDLTVTTTLLSNGFEFDFWLWDQTPFCKPFAAMVYLLFCSCFCSFSDFFIFDHLIFVFCGFAYLCCVCFCRKDCFTSPYFKGCIEALLMIDESEEISQMVETLGKKWGTIIHSSPVRAATSGLLRRLVRFLCLAYYTTYLCSF